MTQSFCYLKVYIAQRSSPNRVFTEYYKLRLFEAVVELLSVVLGFGCIQRTNEAMESVWALER